MEILIETIIKGVVFQGLLHSNSKIGNFKRVKIDTQLGDGVRSNEISASNSEGIINKNTSESLVIIAHLIYNQKFPSIH